MSADSKGASRLATRYAVALYDLADGEGRLDAIADDLRGLHRLIEESADLRRMLRSPALSRAEQGGAIAAIMERAGFSDLTRRFIGVVAENRRLFAVEAMIDAFLARLAEQRGEVVAEVVSAQPLSDVQTGSLQESLRAMLDSKVSVSAKVDKGLIGGLIIKIGSRMIDSSLRTKLQKLQIAMKGIG